MKYELSLKYLTNRVKMIEQDMANFGILLTTINTAHKNLEQAVQANNIQQIESVNINFADKVDDIASKASYLQQECLKASAVLMVIYSANHNQITTQNTAPPVTLMPQTIRKPSTSSSPAPTTAPPQTSVDRTTKCDRTENPDTSKKGCDFNISGKCAQMSDASKCPRRII